jgi:hypothetical protein
LGTRDPKIRSRKVQRKLRKFPVLQERFPLADKIVDTLEKKTLHDLLA